MLDATSAHKYELGTHTEYRTLVAAKKITTWFNNRDGEIYEPNQYVYGEYYSPPDEVDVSDEMDDSDDCDWDPGYGYEDSNDDDRFRPFHTSSRAYNYT